MSIKYNLDILYFRRDSIFLPVGYFIFCFYEEKLQKIQNNNKKCTNWFLFYFIRNQTIYKDEFKVKISYCVWKEGESFFFCFERIRHKLLIESIILEALFHYKIDFYFVLVVNKLFIDSSRGKLEFICYSLKRDLGYRVSRKERAIW